VLDEVRLAGADASDLRTRGLRILDSVVERGSFANAILHDASLARVDFADVRMTGSAFPEAELRDVVFDGCRLDLASFRFAKLERVAFRDCVLTESDFQGARLAGVRFEDCDLTGADFSGATCESSWVSRCTLTDVAGAAGLRGMSIGWTDAVGAVGAFADALGIEVRPSSDE